LLTLSGYRGRKGNLRSLDEGEFDTEGRFTLLKKKISPEKGGPQELEKKRHHEIKTGFQKDVSWRGRERTRKRG